LSGVDGCARGKIRFVNGLEIAEKSVDFLLFDEFAVCVFVSFDICAAAGKDHIINELSDALAVDISEDLTHHAF
jgi:hypothetical protein